MVMYSEYLSHRSVDVADKNPIILDESTNLAEAARLMRKNKYQAFWWAKIANTS
jgi:hypothetical protein